MVSSALLLLVDRVLPPTDAQVHPLVSTLDFDPLVLLWCPANACLRSMLGMDVVQHVLRCLLT